MPHAAFRSAFWVHHPIADQTAETFAAATLAYAREVGGDFIKLTPSGTWQSVGQGAVDEVWPEDVIGRRRVVVPAVREPRDWSDLPDWRTTGLPAIVQEMLRGAELVVDGAPGIPVLATIFNPMTQAFQLAGGPALHEIILADPEAFNAGLRRITANTEFLIEQFADRGVTGLYMSTHMMQPGLCPTSEYRAWSDTNVLHKALGSGLDPVVFHLHGPDILPTLAPELDERVILHLEAGAAEVVGRPIWVGVPQAELRACNTPGDFLALKHRYNPDCPMTAGGCTTLDVPHEEIAAWNAWAKQG